MCWYRAPFKTLNKVHTVQLSLNFYTHVSVHACVCMFITCQTLKFGVHMIASEHTQHMSDACHELTLGLSHYTCGVQVQYTCSWAATNSILQLMK